MMQNESKIWAYLRSKGLNEYATAAVMGNIQAESDGLPNNVENRCPITDAAYTEGVDNGTYTKWETDAFGYGLCQWTYYTRKRALLAYAKEKGVSIADLEMQLDFMLDELKSDFKTVWNSLQTAANYSTPCDRFVREYENPANVTAQIPIRNSYAGAIYDRNKGTATDTVTTATTSTTYSTDDINKLLDGIAKLETNAEAFQEFIKELKELVGRIA